MINFNYTVPVNYFSMYGSFFLNSYDSSVLLHPHSFFNYLTKRDNNRVNFLKKVFKNYYDKKENKFLFYENIINLYKIRKINIINLIYKSNLLCLFFLKKSKLLLNILKLNYYKFYNINLI